jgi:tripartite-type tricarboxylate transporter receptor subunit TctC
VICAHPSLPARTVKDLIALARARPGEINFATAGAGSGAHMATELFLFKAGVRMNHVPYKGTGPALTDLVAGHVALTFGAAAGTLPHVKAQRLRALAVTSAQRFSSEPSIPTVAESGLPGYEVLDWSGLLGPRGLPAAAVDRINDETNKVLTKKEVTERFQQAGLSAGGGEPAQFLERIRREMDMWREVVAKAKIAVN